MEKFSLVNFVEKLTLTDLALRRVAVNLWSEPDVLASIAKIEFSFMQWGKIVKTFQEAVGGTVQGKISKLVVPESLKNELMLIIKPIGSEMRGWKRYHEKYFRAFNEEFPVAVLGKLYWTSLGTINYQKTAEELIRCKMVDSWTCFDLASRYCLEDYMPVVWEELPEKDKRYFLGRDSPRKLVPDYLSHYYWPAILTGPPFRDHQLMNLLSGISINECNFQNSIYEGNLSAAKYFLYKLTQEQKHKSLLSVDDSLFRNLNFEWYNNCEDFPMEKHSEVFFFVLSAMNSEERSDFMHRHLSSCLCYFFHWPLQDFFLEMATLISTSSFKIDYEVLRTRMSRLYMKLEYFSPKLLQQFFTLSSFKKHFVDNESLNAIFLHNAFCKEDTETIKVVFRNIDIEDRMKLLSSIPFHEIFDVLISEEKWHLIELCLQEARLSKGNREILREVFAKFVNTDDKEQRYPQFRWISTRNQWERFFQLLSENDANVTGKRISEDDILNVAKKLCSKDS